MHVAAVGPQIEDRVADDLPGTVVGDVAAAAGFVKPRCRARPAARQSRRCSSAPPSPLHAKRDDGRMLEEQQEIGNAVRAALLDELPLERERLGVRNQLRGAGLRVLRMARTTHAATSDLVGVEVLELLLHVRHELVGDGAVDRADGRSRASGTPSCRIAIASSMTTGPLFDRADAENRRPAAG